MVDSFSTVHRKDEQEIEIIDWEYVKKRIKDWSKVFKKYNKIYGIPRGGLVPAVLISHIANIKLITDKRLIDNKTLIVDDICDSGNTLYQTNKQFPNVDTFAIILSNNSTFKPTHYIKKHTSKRWIVFPWEYE